MGCQKNHLSKTHLEAKLEENRREILFLMVPWVGLQCVIVPFPGHTYFVFGLCYQVRLNTEKTIRIHHKCEGEIEKSIPRITDWHHKACRVMTNGDRERWIFYPTLIRIMDYFSCSPLITSFYIRASRNS